MKPTYSLMAVAIISIVLLDGVFAQEEAPPPPQKQTPATVAPTASPSSGTTPVSAIPTKAKYPRSNLRDPFLPPAYRATTTDIVPQATNAGTNVGVQPPDVPQEVKWPPLKLKALSSKAGGQKGWIGILQGVEGTGIVEGGEIVKMKRSGMIFKWRIDAVTADGVKATPLEAVPGR